MHVVRVHGRDYVRALVVSEDSSLMGFHGDRSHANECVTIVNQSLLYQLNQ